jgi:hypothetical protein
MRNVIFYDGVLEVDVIFHQFTSGRAVIEYDDGRLDMVDIDRLCFNPASKIYKDKRYWGSLDEGKKDEGKK